DFVDADAVDHNVFNRLVTGILLHGLDLLDHSLRLFVFDLSEDGVLALQPGGGHRRDEELRAVGATTHLDTGVRHRQYVGLGEVELGVDLVIELVAGATGALAERVAALNHEVVDDAVEDHTVVQRVLGDLSGGGVGPFDLAGGQPDEIGNGLGGVVGQQVDFDVAQRSVQGRYMCVHASSISLMPVCTVQRIPSFFTGGRVQG